MNLYIDLYTYIHTHMVLLLLLLYNSIDKGISWVRESKSGKEETRYLPIQQIHFLVYSWKESSGCKHHPLEPVFNTVALGNQSNTFPAHEVSGAYLKHNRGVTKQLHPGAHEPPRVPSITLLPSGAPPSHWHRAQEFQCQTQPCSLPPHTPRNKRNLYPESVSGYCPKEEI